MVSAYLQRHPNRQLSLKNRNSDNILRALLAHEIELGIVEGIHKVSHVTYTPLLADDVVAVCAAGNPLGARILEARDLLGIPLALREDGSGTLAVLEEALRHRGLKLAALPVRVRLGGTEALKNFVRVDSSLAFSAPAGGGEGVGLGRAGGGDNQGPAHAAALQFYPAQRDGKQRALPGFPVVHQTLLCR